MAKIFITGSSDGLGLLAAQSLMMQGHQVVLHARNQERKSAVLLKLNAAHEVVVGDLSSVDETKKLAEDLNSLGPFDVVIHNAGVYQVAPKTILAVNTLAPYLLTCSMAKASRLIYLSSGMHHQGRFNLRDFDKGVMETSYSNSKLHVVMLANAVARRWKNVLSNSIDPGWVPTKMGGAGAPDDLKKGYETQVWLATSDEKNAMVTGQYFFHGKQAPFNAMAADVSKQEELLKACEQLTGIAFE
jgi:NAD(P)-dependent dehydrogenase (short-subunit alcohol dehydrogenase family)